jgi:predicted metal-binding protein
MHCKTCTYPDAPCRFPEKMSASMEALGMVVSDVCKDNNLPYYYGAGTLTFVGCVLLE